MNYQVRKASVKFLCEKCVRFNSLEFIPLFCPFDLPVVKYHAVKQRTKNRFDLEIFNSALSRPSNLILWLNRQAVNLNAN